MNQPIFIQGPISSQFIGEVIAQHQNLQNTGAQNIFLGQVRADNIEEKVVTAIDYSCYQAMAEKAFENIQKSAAERFSVTSLHIHHSLGKVPVGEICLFVLAASKHRDLSYKASRYVVEEIKAKIPIFGKELFEDATHQWKKNR